MQPVLPFAVHIGRHIPPVANRRLAHFWGFLEPIRPCLSFFALFGILTLPQTLVPSLISMLPSHAFYAFRAFRAVHVSHAFHAFRAFRLL